MVKRGNNKRKPSSYWVYIILVGIFLGLNLFSGEGFTASRQTTPISFETFLKNGDIRDIVIVNKKVAEVYIKEEAKKKQIHSKLSKKSLLSSSPDYEFEFGSLENLQKKLDEAKKEGIDFSYRFETQSNIFGSLLMSVLPFVIIIFVWIFIMRRMSGGSKGSGGPMSGGSIFSIGKSRARIFDENSNVKITFKDVAGLEGAKEEIEELVDFLKSPDKYTALGGKIPRGMLLVGPPGTGKTLLAKAVAGEAKVPFFSISGSDFVEMFVGVGASRVRDLFKQAKEKSPSIIFIDEIDAIGRARGRSGGFGGNDERENTLNQLLTEMDGFETNSNVIVIAATNRKDVLDKALMRAGRFDRQIYIDLPGLNERKEIFKVHLKPIKVVQELDIDFLSKQTPGFSGAEIANMCNEAALIAARKGQNEVNKQDFLDAVDRIVGGIEKKNKVISDKEKDIIAYHEAGHATVSWMLEHASPLVKVTIVPRGQSLGAAWYLPEERQLVQKEQMLDEICATLAGRASEEVFFGKISTGALNDLEKVTKQARAMVSYYGMSPQVGNITYYDSADSEYSFTKPYSEKTAETIDKEILDLIEEQYQRAIALIKKHKRKLEKLAKNLLEKEVIFKEDLETIFGSRPFEKEKKIEEKTS